MSWAEFMTLGVMALDEGRAPEAAACFRDALLLASCLRRGLATSERRDEARRYLEEAERAWLRRPGAWDRVRRFREETRSRLRAGHRPAGADLPGDPRGAPVRAAPSPSVPPRRPVAAWPVPRPPPWPPESWSACMEAGLEALEAGRPGAARPLLEHALGLLAGGAADDMRRSETLGLLARAEASQKRVRA